MPALPETLSLTERQALSDFLARVRSLLGPDLLEARLFGSRARGEGDEHSDLDVALIVTARGRELRREIHGLTFDSVYEHGIDVEPLVITRDQLRHLQGRELSIGKALEREAILL